jgi:hypothetical protein
MEVLLDSREEVKVFEGAETMASIENGARVDESSDDKMKEESILHLLDGKQN